MSEAPARVVWRNEFSLGIPAVDHEHREMVALINEIFVRIEADDTETVADDLGEIHARISAHFALEEQIMRREGYDQFDDHKADHEHLLDDIREIMDAYADGSYGDRKDAFAGRLQRWFVDHFKTKDARLHRRLRT
ncbi:MAG: bacteriohemerythrin [Defluviicoccus sp.]|nr:bacteriohemerythrin [Defluviicoccus sp.]